MLSWVGFGSEGHYSGNFLHSKPLATVALNLIESKKEGERKIICSPRHRRGRAEMASFWLYYVSTEGEHIQITFAYSSFNLFNSFS